MIVNGEKAAWETGLTVEKLLETRNYRTDPGCCRKERRDRSKEKLFHRRDPGRGSDRDRQFCRRRLIL